MGADAANAKIATLDLNPSQISVDYLRNQGFLTGFGIDVADPTRIGDETDPRVIGSDVTNGNEEGGRSAIENLLQRDPGINLVYTINESVAAGAYEALRSMNRQDEVLIVPVDGGCPGVQNVAEGIIGATSMQFPLLMASKGIEAIKTYADTGAKPANSDGLDFFNTGVELITDSPVDGVPSISSAEGLARCWGEAPVQPIVDLTKTSCRLCAAQTQRAWPFAAFLAWQSNDGASDRAGDQPAGLCRAVVFAEQNRMGAACLCHRR